MLLWPRPFFQVETKWSNAIVMLQMNKMKIKKASHFPQMISIGDSQVRGVSGRQGVRCPKSFDCGRLDSLLHSQRNRANTWRRLWEVACWLPEPVDAWPQEQRWILVFLQTGHNDVFQVQSTRYIQSPIPSPQRDGLERGLDNFVSYLALDIDLNLCASIVSLVGP